MDRPAIVWIGRPIGGPAWRPQDLSPTLFTSFWAAVTLWLMLALGGSVFFTILVVMFSSYSLVGRFYHDASLRRRIRYELTSEGLAVYLEGRPEPKCLFPLADLRHVTPLFVKRSGVGTIELPPGGWASHPVFIDRWDLLVPAMYPCRRLELIPDVEAVAEMICRESRRQARGLL